MALDFKKESEGEGRKPPIVTVYTKPGEPVRKTKGNYVFPNFLAIAMSKVSQRTQMEASLMSMTVILLGILLLAFAALFTGLNWYIKTLTIINALAAFVFLSSNLVSTYQAYKSYLAVMGLLKDRDPFEIPKELKGGNDL